MLKDIILRFKYIAQGKDFSALLSEGEHSYGVFTAKLEIAEVNTFCKLKLTIIPKEELVLEELSIEAAYDYSGNQRIFVNGYQSWTDSREFEINERIKGISKLANPLMKKYHFDKYGDYIFKKYPAKAGELHGYTYSYIREGERYSLIGSLSEREGFTAIEHSTSQKKLRISKECKGLHIRAEYIPFNLILAEGTEKEVFDAYFQAMGINRPAVKPMTGWTSWYNYYQNISESIILENLDQLSSANKNIEIFQIDDGYQTAVGDWLSIDKDKFPTGMKALADSIRSRGYKAGIWLAPFVCERSSEVFKYKGHWLLRDRDNEPVTAGSNWSGFYALDIYNTEVREYLQKVFDTVLNHWGYDLVKLDFLYAACMLPREDKTRGQIMTEAMELLRGYVGDKLILGCGVPLGPAFGLVDYCRIGCDVSLDWDDKAYMKLFHRERVSTLNSIRNAIGRRHLDGRAFMNDPDVFLLRDDNIMLSEHQKKTLSLVNKLFGSLLFTSDNIKHYNAEKHSWFDQIMTDEKANITTVNEHKNGLVEVNYTEKGRSYIAVMNFQKRKVTYKAIDLEPFESRVLDTGYEIYYKELQS